MSINESSARARQLGAELRRERKRTGYTAHELAVQLGWSASKISRMEAGRRGTLAPDVAIYLARCGAPRADRERLVRLAEDSEAAFRLQGHGERLPDELRSLIELETQPTPLSGTTRCRFLGCCKQSPMFARCSVGRGGTATRHSSYVFRRGSPGRAC